MGGIYHGADRKNSKGNERRSCFKAVEYSSAKKVLKKKEDLGEMCLKTVDMNLFIL
jgi:hypothetical protein